MHYILNNQYVFRYNSQCPCVVALTINPLQSMFKSFSMKFVLYALLLIVLATACQRLISSGGAGAKGRPGKSQPAPAGAETALVKQAGIKRYYLNVNGDDRTFLVQLPKGYNPAETYPVIFFFHAIRGTDTSWIRTRGMNEYVDKFKYIAIYAQGANGGIWNIGGYYPLKKVSEPDFVMKMYNWLKQNTKIDAKRVYAVGSSNGGLIAHYLAIKTNIFAAIVPISGSLYTDEMQNTAEPTAILQIHGMVDKTIPYNGGYTQYHYTYLSAENSVKTWAQLNGCTAAPTVTNLLGGKVIVQTYNNCKTGKPAILYSLPNIPHKVLQTFDATWIYNQIFDFLSKNSK